MCRFWGAGGHRCGMYETWRNAKSSAVVAGADAVVVVGGGGGGVVLSRM